MRRPSRPNAMTGAGWIILAASAVARIASAETAPPPSVPPLLPATLRLELAAPERVSVKIRPEIGEIGEIGTWGTCPPSCRLAVYPGRYLLEAEPPQDSGLRRVRGTLDLSSDALVQVAPGSSSERGWGLGLTIGGSVVFALGMVFAFSHELGAGDPSKNVVALTMIGAGAPLTLGGIYLLVHGRNRITVEPAGQRSAVPSAPSSAVHLGVGGRF